MTYLRNFCFACCVIFFMAPIFAAATRQDAAGLPSFASGPTSEDLLLKARKIVERVTGSPCTDAESYRSGQNQIVTAIDRIPLGQFDEEKSELWIKWGLHLQKGPMSSLALGPLCRAEVLCHRIDNNHLLAQCLSRKAIAIVEIERYGEASATLIEAERIANKTRNDTLLSTILVNHGEMLLKYKNDYKKSIEYFQKSLNLARAAKDMPSEANALRALASAQNLISKYSESLKNIRQAASIYSKINNKIGQSKCGVEEGEILYGLSDFSAAIDKFRVALNISRSIDDRRISAWAQVGLGRALFSAGRPREAIQEYDAAIRYYEAGTTEPERLKNDRDGQAVWAKMCKAAALTSLKKYSEALSLYESVEDFYRSRHRQMHLGLAIRYKSQLLYFAGRLNEAQRGYEEALRLLSESGADRVVAGLMMDLAAVHKSSGDFAISIDYYNEAVVMLEAICFSQVAAVDRNASETFRRRWAGLPQAVFEVVKMLDDPDDRRDGIDVLFRISELVNSRSLSEKRLAQDARTINPVEIGHQLESFAALIHISHTRNFFDSVNKSRVSGFRKNKKRGAAWALVTTSRSFDLVELGAPDAIYRDSVVLRRHLDRDSSNDPPAELMRRLGGAVLDPILAYLEDRHPTIQTLLFSVQGELARIPLEPLLVRTSQSGESANVEHLSMSYDVAYVPSGSGMIALCAPSPSITTRQKDFFAFGYPADEIMESTEFGTPVGGAPNRSRRRPLLEGTWQEVLEVARLHVTDDKERDDIEDTEEALDDDPLVDVRETVRLSGDRFEVALRSAATEHLFKTDSNVRSARIIHFAGHAEADLRSPEKSRLVFAQSPTIQKKTGEDGFLYLNELRDMELSADLLTLSACQTNDGKLTLVEGVHGMAWAGLMAGAKSVMSTLWKVRDDAARDLVVDFYQRWPKTGVTRIRALAEAKRAAIKRGAKVRDWAAYILWDAEVGKN